MGEIIVRQLIPAQLRPEDVLVVECPGHCSQQLKDEIARALFPHTGQRRIVILTHGLKLQVAAPPFPEQLRAVFALQECGEDKPQDPPAHA